MKAHPLRPPTAQYLQRIINSRKTLPKPKIFRLTKNGMSQKDFVMKKQTLSKAQGV